MRVATLPATRLSPGSASPGRATAWRLVREDPSAGRWSPRGAPAAAKSARFELVASTLSGYAELQAEVQIRDGDGARNGLVAWTPLLVVEVVERPKATEVRWRLDPGERDPVRRADALDFLHALFGVGALSVVDHGDRDLTQVRLSAVPWPADLDAEWRFVSDLAVLREWSGVSLEVPDEASAAEVAAAAHAASCVRTQRVPATIVEPFEAIVRGDSESQAPDEIRLEQLVGLELLGSEIPLGLATASVSVEVDSVTAVEGEPGLHRVRLRPLVADEIVFVLQPPPTRILPPRRTQQPDAAPPWEGDRDDSGVVRAVDETNEWLSSLGASQPTAPLSMLADLALDETDLTGAASRLLDEQREDRV